MTENRLFVALLVVFAIAGAPFGFVIGRSTKDCPKPKPVPIARVSPDGPAYACLVNGKVVPCHAP